MPTPTAFDRMVRRGLTVQFMSLAGRVMNPRSAATGLPGDMLHYGSRRI